MSGGAALGPGVYCHDSPGDPVLVYAYQGGNYRLADVAGIFQLGRIEGGAQAGESVLVLGAADVPKLKTLADAFSFDYDEEFIEMCHALHRSALSRGGDNIRFTANFEP